jgi:hypothetical protein
LWLALGISVTSFVGTPLILYTKTSRPADGAQTEQTFRQLVSQRTASTRNGTVLADASNSNQLAIAQQDKGVTVSQRGILVVKSSVQQADWSDMFRGEETGNAAQIDLSKVQQFYFTLIVVVAYVSSLVLMFTGVTVPSTLPALAQSLVALLALSNGGYLVNKAIPHSQPPQS